MVTKSGVRVAAVHLRMLNDAGIYAAKRAAALLAAEVSP